MRQAAFELPDRGGDFWGNYEKNLGIVKENKTDNDANCESKSDKKSELSL